MDPKLCGDSSDDFPPPAPNSFFSLEFYHRCFQIRFRIPLTTSPSRDALFSIQLCAVWSCLRDPPIPMQLVVPCGRAPFFPKPSCLLGACFRIRGAPDFVAPSLEPMSFEVFQSLLPKHTSDDPPAG